VLGLLCDTSVWLDLATDVNGQKVITTVRVLADEGRVTVLVPQIVIDEFEDNRAMVQADMTRSLSSHFRLVRQEIEKHGQGRGRDAALSELDNLAHRVPLINETATRNFDDVHELLVAGKRLAPTADDRERAVQRALEGRAPFHRARNSIADALIIEMYATAVAQEGHDGYCFVTRNTKDFSAVGEDHRIPHPDLAELFARPGSGYFLSLAAALAAHYPDEFDELLAEFDFHEEPRSYEEIRAAEEEMFDRIWYDRSMYHEHEDGTDVEELRRIAGPGRVRVEAKYGADNLGPYDKFEWGMLNGKLSALRWVLGSEWDFLDT
jgi:hypothetical protein